MKKFLSSRFFAVVLVIAICMALVPGILSFMGLSDYVRKGVATILMPGQKFFGYIADGISGYTDYFTEYDRLVEENEYLREQLSEMQDKVYTAGELERMNNWLYDYLELKRQHMDFTLVDANVTGRQSSNYMSVITIDRGTSDGCRENMPVISSDGIVGYIAQAGLSWSKVVTISEATSAVGAMVERTGQTGLVSGSYSLAADGLVKMSYLPADCDVKEGDRIVTNGYGSVYPRGLTVGYVERVELDDYGQTPVAYISVAASHDDLTNVMVITDYESYTPEQ